GDGSLHLRRGAEGTRRSAFSGDAAVHGHALGIARRFEPRSAAGATASRSRHVGSTQARHAGADARTPLSARGVAGLIENPSQYVRERKADGRKDLRYPAAPEPLTVPVYDNHAHLEILDGDDPLTLTEQLDRAAAVGILG